MPPNENLGKHRLDDPDAYYNPKRNGRPLVIIRKPVHPNESTAQHVIDSVLDALRYFDIKRINSQSVADLVTQLMVEGSPDAPNILIPLGCCGDIDYDISLQRLGPGSLNSEDDVNSMDCQSPYSPVVNLRFSHTMPVKGLGAATRRAIVLGRIVGPHQHKEHLVQSRWIVVLDQTRLLWVLYANNIDTKDVAVSKTGDSIPYSVAWDTAFGASKSSGQKVILLGSLKDISFRIAKKLSDPEIYELDWSTTPVPIIQSVAPEPKPLVPISTVKRLLDVDTSFFKIPRYRKKHMTWLKNVLRYDRFCEQLDKENETEGIVIGRNLTEAAWCKVVIRGYKAMGKVFERRTGNVFLADLECLSECLAQRRSASMYKYWLDKSTKYPGLDLVSVPDTDPTEDDSTELATWALDMLRENKGQGSKSVTDHSAVSANVENTDASRLDTEMTGTGGMEDPSSNPPSGEVIFKRAKAEAEGLIRFIKKSGDTGGL